MGLLEKTMMTYKILPGTDKEVIDCLTRLHGSKEKAVDKEALKQVTITMPVKLYEVLRRDGYLVRKPPKIRWY